MHHIRLPFILALILCCGSAYAQGNKCFVLGSTQSLVRNVMGTPSSIYKNEGKEYWYFGKSTVTFKDGMVSEYDNYGRNLRICKEVVNVMSKEMQEKQGFLLPERSKSKATKADTQDWLLEKLNTYVSKSNYAEGYYSATSNTQYPGKTIENTSFSIEGNFIIVRFHVADERYPHDESYTIPIYDLKRLHGEEGNLVLTTKSGSIVHTIGKQQMKENKFSTKFDFATEANIKPRLVSALAHLMKFYKSPVKKETF
jgi:hypothetical protein